VVDFGHSLVDFDQKRKRQLGRDRSLPVCEGFDLDLDLDPAENEQDARSAVEGRRFSAA